MVWLATPSELRVPLTETALAEELKVNPATLWKWKQKPGFKEQVQRLITESLGDDYHDVMHAFKAEAKKGSYQHQKMYMEMLGVYVPKIAPTNPDGTKQYNPQELTDEQLTTIASLAASSGE